MHLVPFASSEIVQFLRILLANMCRFQDKIFFVICFLNAFCLFYFNDLNFKCVSNLQKKKFIVYTTRQRLGIRHQKALKTNFVEKCKARAHSVPRTVCARRQPGDALPFLTKGSCLIWSFFLYFCWLEPPTSSVGPHTQQDTKMKTTTTMRTTLTPILIIILLFWHLARHCFWRQIACTWKTMHDKKFCSKKIPVDASYCLKKRDYFRHKPEKKQ